MPGWAGPKVPRIYGFRLCAGHGWWPDHDGMDATHVHVCPRCPLRFVSRAEPEGHLGEEHGVDLRRPAEVVAVEEEPLPAVATPRWGMVTVPMDPGRPATLAADAAVTLAAQAGMAVELVAVLPEDLPMSATAVYLDARRRALSASAGAQAPPCTRHVLWRDDAADVIVAYAGATGSTMLCMATHSRGALGEAVLGSVSEVVLRKAPVPVLLVGPNVRAVPDRYRRVVAAVDGSEPAEHALAVAAGLDGHLNAGLFLVQVLGLSDMPPPDADVLEAGYLSRVAGRLPVGFDILHSPNAARAIVNFVSPWDGRLIVMGTHGRSNLGRIVMGSVALDVVRHARRSSRRSFRRSARSRRCRRRCDRTPRPAGSPPEHPSLCRAEPLPMRPGRSGSRSCARPRRHR